MKISIILPTLNEEKALPATLRNVAECAPGCEVIVADGGSADGTKECVKNFTTIPILWLDAQRGRGAQMNAGAARATGDILLFLHADTHLPPGTPDRIARALADPNTLGGNFRIQFVPRAPLADFYTWGYNLRSLFHIFYGDSALFLRRSVFEQMAGYQAARIMEDIELVLRLRRAGRLVYIGDAAVTSSTRRFPSTWIGLKMLGVWTLLHLLMACGVKQETLERLYPEAR